jgi:hypothetical protein
MLIEVSDILLNVNKPKKIPSRGVLQSQSSSTYSISYHITDRAQYHIGYGLKWQIKSHNCPYNPNNHV